MSSPAETQKLMIAELLQEAEEAPSASEGLEPSGRQLSGLRGSRRMVFGAGFAVAAMACIGLVAWPQAPAPPAARMDASQGKASEDLIQPFQQCGGKGWVNSTCCTKGCACVVETRYYSQCKAPEGLNHCDFDRARVEKDAAKSRVEDRKTDLEERREASKEAEDHLDMAMKVRRAAEEKADKASKDADVLARHLRFKEATAGEVLKKAERDAGEELDEVVEEAKASLAEKTQSATELRDSKLEKARSARAAAEKAKKEKRAAFEDANKAYAAKTKERGQVKDYVDKYEAAEKVRKEKKCGALFSDCTASNCCVVGCEPHWQTKFYCQCAGPGGAQYCAAKELIDRYQKSTKAMPTLTKDFRKLDEANETAASRSREADEHYDEVAEKAERDINAAKEEFETSTKVPAGVADKKIHAAKEKAAKAVQEAKDEFRKKTAAARAMASKAKEVAHAAEAVAKAKRGAEASAAEAASSAAQAVMRAKEALASAKVAVKSWVRAASGSFCGEASDATHLDF